MLVVVLNTMLAQVVEAQIIYILGKLRLPLRGYFVARQIHVDEPPSAARRYVWETKFSGGDLLYVASMPGDLVGKANAFSGLTTAGGRVCANCVCVSACVCFTRTD